MAGVGPGAGCFRSEPRRNKGRRDLLNVPPGLLGATLAHHSIVTSAARFALWNFSNSLPSANLAERAQLFSWGRAYELELDIGSDCPSAHDRHGGCRFLGETPS